MRQSQLNLLQRPLWAAVLVSALAVFVALPRTVLATVGQSSITLVGGVTTVVQHDNTSWDSSKTLNAITPDPSDPTGDSGTVSWKVTVTKTAVSDKTIEADGLLTVQNTGAYPATIGNIVVNLQQFQKTCKPTDEKNIWVSRAADMADAYNGDTAASDNIVANASQEMVATDQACGGKNYTTKTYKVSGNTYTEGTFVTTPGSGTVEFNYLGNSTFSILAPNNSIAAGQSVTLTYQATFDNTTLNIPAGSQIRTETIVTFGNAGARGGSGASAPNIDIDGDGVVSPSEAWVRSVPTRTSLTVPSTCIHCNQLVNLTDTPDDLATAGDLSITPDTFSFTANVGDTGVTQLTDINNNTYFLLDGSQVATGASETFTVSFGYSVVDCSRGTISNTAQLSTDQYPVAAPYSWDVNGDLLLQIGVDGLGNPIDVVICTGLNQQPSDTETINSGDFGSPACTINPPPPPLNGYCTFLQSQWSHSSGSTLNALMPVMGSETIGSGGTHTAKWNSAAAIGAYLPAGGSNGALNASLLDPTSTSAGHFGGEVLALQLNVDLGTHSPPVTVGGNSVFDFGSLLICGTGTQFDGQRVDALLAAANLAVGGGSLPTNCTGQGTCDFNSLDTLLQHVNVSFQHCHETGFGLHHLVKGSSCP
ncbi:hypothetical protein [Candidatus Binatus sp.]|uniref:hypothetical protein n=1 Tax=Candidatus Binatus sp. TaxID=2811406 RepID=UPI003BB120AA